ncbi:MAG: hypothetical protein ACLQBD_02290 [Syntrophobacteraceae bacterium]
MKRWIIYVLRAIFLGNTSVSGNRFDQHRRYMGISQAAPIMYVTQAWMQWTLH